MGVVKQDSSTDLVDLGIMIDEAEHAHEVLGLPRNPSSSEIRSAYIKLAKEFHPDAHPQDPAAEARFKRVSEAYNQLRWSYLAGDGVKTYRASKSWASYRQKLGIAALFFVLIPAAILLVTRTKERPAPLLEPSQVEVPSLPGPAIEAALAPTAPQARSAALENKYPSSTLAEVHPSDAASEVGRSPGDISPKSGAVPGFQIFSSQSDIAVASPADERVQSRDESMADLRDENGQKGRATAQPGMALKGEAAFNQISPANSKAAAASPLSGKVARQAVRSQSPALEVVRDAPGKSATEARAETYPRQAGISTNAPVYFGVGQ